MDFNGTLIGSGDPERLSYYDRKLFGEPGGDDGGYTGTLGSSPSLIPTTTTSR